MVGGECWDFCSDLAANVRSVNILSSLGQKQCVARVCVCVCVCVGGGRDVREMRNGISVGGGGGDSYSVPQYD